MFRVPEPARSAPDFFPPRVALATLRDAASGCRGCALYQNATQTGFGKGSEGAEIMFIGEQPGDKEDLAGEPFVGPAGKLLDSALREAGIDRSLAYVTNVVKHFKWKPSRPPGKRRIHEKPNAVEVAACRPWLEAELDVVRPRIIVMLGSTAAQTIMGKDFRVTRDRGQFWVSDYGPLITATVHPSSILRSPDDTTRAAEMREFIHDLRTVAEKLEELRTAAPA